ncbi:DUF1847 domain-containing protein [Chloroflexota bacterium]
MTEKMQCSRCTVQVCTVDSSGKLLPGDAPSWCPMKNKADVIQKAMAKHTDEDHKIAHTAAVVESEAYIRETWGLRPLATRVLEIVNFAKKMGFKKIGLASCFACMWEARVIANIFINRDFIVVARYCKILEVKNTSFLGIKEEETLVPGGFQSMCNPIAQVDCLVDSGCELIVAFGQCTGHDALSGKFSRVPFTLLGGKDRVLAHNPVVALTNPWNQYYRKLNRKEPLKIVYENGHYRSY